MSNIYLSGPMTGLPERNYPAFAAAAADLRDNGRHEVYAPHEWETYCQPQQPKVNQPTRPFDLHHAFADYCEWIINTADMVFVLPGWENSPGASAEVALARAIRKPVFSYETGLRLPDPTLDAAPPCERHVERQHRDAKPPWCPHCGWRHAKSEPARKLGRSRAERDEARGDQYRGDVSM